MFVEQRLLLEIDEIMMVDIIPNNFYLVYYIFLNFTNLYHISFYNIYRIFEFHFKKVDMYININRSFNDILSHYPFMTFLLIKFWEKYGVIKENMISATPESKTNYYNNITYLK